jgi:hypothetical protein
MKILRRLYEAIEDYPLVSTSKTGPEFGLDVGGIGRSRTGKLYKWNGRNWSKYVDKNLSAVQSSVPVSAPINQPIAKPIQTPVSEPTLNQVSVPKVKTPKVKATVYKSKIGDIGVPLADIFTDVILNKLYYENGFREYKKKRWLDRDEWIKRKHEGTLDAPETYDVTRYPINKVHLDKLWDIIGKYFKSPYDLDISKSFDSEPKQCIFIVGKGENYYGKITAKYASLLLTPDVLKAYDVPEYTLPENNWRSKDGRDFGIKYMEIRNKNVAPIFGQLFADLFLPTSDQKATEIIKVKGEFNNDYVQCNNSLNRSNQEKGCISFNFNIADLLKDLDELEPAEHTLNNP